MPSRDSGSALLLVKRGSHDVLIESTEAHEVSEGQATRSAAVACELTDVLLIFVPLALFPPNEKELSHRWRRRALLYSQQSSLNPQLSQYTG